MSFCFVNNKPQMDEDLPEYCSNENLVLILYHEVVVYRKITDNSNFSSFTKGITHFLLWSLMNTVMNLWVPQKAGNLTS
jgi:hypothetical protein